MDQKTFIWEMRRAKALAPENPDYWAGYRRGLRRQYHGKNFGTREEHARWLAFDRDGRGRGYRAGYSFTSSPFARACANGPQ